MAIEAIKGAGMTYQGSSSSAEVRAEATAKVERAENAIASENLAKETSAIETKQTSGENAGGAGAGANTSELVAAQEAKKAQIKKAVEDINKRANNSEAIFGIHEDTNRVTIKIVDKQTKDVIKEFPPDKTLDMIAKVWEMAGLMVDEKR